MSNFIAFLNTKRIVSFIVTTLIFTFFVYFNVTRKTILVLHSYNNDYIWVQNLNEGIKRVLKTATNVDVRWHYMDTKNHPDDPFKKRAGAIGQEIIGFLKPDVILAIDDDAQEYVAAHYKNRDDIKIVFAGVNAVPERYGYDKATNVTGILERLPIEGIKEAVQVLADQVGISSPVRVSHVSDSSLVVGFDDNNMRGYPNWAPLKFGKSFLCDTFDDWKKAILGAKDHMDFMLITNYRKLAKVKGSAERVPYKEAMKWAFEHSPVPIIGINGFVCEDGAALGIGTSPFEQGEISMKMALDLVNGTPIDKIGIVSSRQFIVLIDEGRYEQSFIKKGMHLPTVYEAFARATNKFFPKAQKNN